MKYSLCLFFLFVLFSCSKKDPIIVGGGNAQSIRVNFDNSSYSILEGSSDDVVLSFTEELMVNSTINVRVTEISGMSDINYTIRPSAVGDNISLLASAGASSISVNIAGLIDSDLKTEELELEIIGVVGTGLSIGNTKIARVSIVDDSPVDEQYRDCLMAVSDEEFEIATWNIRQFPQSGNTISSLLDVIPDMGIDLIAVQEIQDIGEFQSLAANLPGWTGVVEDISGDIDLGFLYKNSAITSFGTITQLFTNDFNAYPREAVEVDVQHVNGLTVKLINIHLKCCSDGAQRRISASNKMKDYIDANHNSDNVIVIGDFNEDIDSGSAFANFSSDSDNYFFADQAIADGDNSQWSFPSFPSHIDHILCTNELSDNFINTYTLKLDDCIGNYTNVVSDHRPVVAVFQ